MPKRGETCDYIPVGIQNENSYSGTIFNWRYETDKYPKSNLKELIAYVQYSATIKNNIDEAGYAMCNLYKIQKDTKMSVSDRKMPYKDFLFECGFFYENFGWERDYKIANLKKVLSNKLLVPIFLLMIVGDILEDIESQPHFSTDWKGEIVKNELEGYVEERVIVSSIIDKVREAEQQDKESIELSNIEYHFLLNHIFGENNHIIGFDVEELNDLMNEFNAIENNLESVLSSWGQLFDFLKQKYQETTNVFLGDSDAPVMKAMDVKGNMEIEVPCFMRTILVGLANQYEKLPITIGTNLWGNGTWEEIKALWKEIKIHWEEDYGSLFDSDEDKKMPYASNNIPRSPEIKIFPYEAVEKRVYKSFYSVINYIRYSSQMDQRKNRDDIFERYVEGVGGMTYYLAYEKNTTYLYGAVFVFESMFGMYVMKLELDIVTNAIRNENDSQRLKTSGIIWKNYLPKILRKIFLVKNSFVRIYIVEKFLEQCISDLVCCEEMGDEEQVANDWMERISFYNNIGETLEVDYRSSDSFMNRESISNDSLKNYRKFYDDIIKLWKNAGDRILQRKLVSEFNQRLTSIKEKYPGYEKNLASWMIQCSLGLHENFRIKVTE